MRNIEASNTFIKDCIRQLKKEGITFVFSEQQLNSLYNNIDNNSVNVNVDDGIYTITTKK